MEKTPRSTIAGVALIALATLMLEVNITRIFAVTLWYYFGFLAISLALLGTAAAGVLCFVRSERWIGGDHRQSMTRFCLALALLTPNVIWMHLSIDFTNIRVLTSSFYFVLGFQLCLFFVLFFCAGMAITIALFRYNENIGKIYFADLLGASAGSVAVIILLYRFSAPAVTFAVSAAACLAALAFSWDRAAGTKAVLASLAVICIALLVANDRVPILAVKTVKTYRPQQVQQKELGKVFEKWSPVSRVAVFMPSKGERGEYRVVTNDAGAPTVLNRFDGDFSKLEWMDRIPDNIGYQLRPDAETLIIGSAGGRDVLAALKFGNRKITAVEINPVIGELVTKYYAGYIGHIFEDPRVTLHIQEGRNYTAGSEDRYDLIKATMIDSWAGSAAGAYLFNENTLYTLEAVRDYYTHLKDGGIISITRYYVWDEAARVLNTYLTYLDGLALPASKRIIVVNELKTGYQRSTLLLKKGDFTDEEVSKVLLQARLGHSLIVHAPGVDESLMIQTPYARFMRALISASKRDRDLLVDGFHRNITPSTDDRPFFFFMDRLSAVFHVNHDDHPARRLAIPLLYGSFIVLAVLAILTIIVPLNLRKDLSIRQAPHRTPMLIYFAGLGVGFMLIEISLIHRLTVFLGQPAYSFVIVLTSLLFASGIGSLVASRWSKSPSYTPLVVVLGAIVAGVLVTAFLIYDRFIDLMWLPLPSRMGLSILVLLAIGFPLGMCFPLGMQLARRFHRDLVPWGWGVNGAFSVFASACSLVIALNLGLKTMMLIGALCYLINLAVIYRIRETASQQVPSAIQPS